MANKEEHKKRSRVSYQTSRRLYGGYMKKAIRTSMEREKKKTIRERVGSFMNHLRKSVSRKKAEA